jgi:predicted ATP-dependent endonuclease of OLD family
VQVSPTPSSGQKSYAGGEMSDGERAIFYFLGQCLVAPENAAIIIDEPEAHVHKSILQQLWNSIELPQR